jgi:hypothetical protein
VLAPPSVSATARQAVSRSTALTSYAGCCASTGIVGGR